MVTLQDADDNGEAPESQPEQSSQCSQPEQASQSEQALTAEVKKCKAVLDGKGSPKEDMLAALMALKQMGSLPTKVLSDTLVGKSVNTVAKSAADEDVKAKAKEVVEQWRQEHRKRKAASEAGTGPPVKRGLTAQLSFSEAPAEPNTTLSQDASPTAASTPQTTPKAMSRSDSFFSAADSQDLSQGDREVAPHRQKVRQKLLEALGKAEEIEAKDGKEGGEEEMRDPVRLADEIDQELHKAHPKKEEYMKQARSVLFNLQDKKNHTFKFKLMVGFFKPSDVPTLTAEQMASDEKQEERAKQRKYAMEEIQSDWALKNGAMRFTGMFTCGKCKGTKTTYFQMQTRSSDEPMTTFVSCITCNNRWKFC